jgi:hypothetical protein
MILPRSSETVSFEASNDRKSKRISREKSNHDARPIPRLNALSVHLLLCKLDHNLIVGKNDDIGKGGDVVIGGYFVNSIQSHFQNSPPGEPGNRAWNFEKYKISSPLTCFGKRNINSKGPPQRRKTMFRKIKAN